MGNEISTVGGAVATAATGTLSAVTFGQVDAINNATKECAKFTASKAQETMVYTGSKMTVAAVAGTVTGAAGLISGSESLKEAAGEMFDECGDAATKFGTGVVGTANGVLNAVPGVGHVKGVIHDVCGDDEGARKAYFTANRTSAVVGGALAGSVLGPAGAIAGGIAGGAAGDGANTGYASLKDGKYSPQGQIASWTQVVNAKDAQEVVGGIVDGVTAPIFDAVTGATVYKTVGSTIRGKHLEAKADAMLEKAENARWAGNTPEGKVIKMYDQSQAMHNEAMKLQNKVVVAENLKGGGVEVAQPNQVYVVGSGPSPTTDEQDKDDDDEHEPKNVHLKVFYVNARSINPKNECKVKWIKKQIGNAKPDIVAIVETWLTGKTTDATVLHSLGLNDFRLFRQDRIDKDSSGNIRRGGGMIVAIKSRIAAEVISNYADNFMGIMIRHTFNCAKCSGTKTKSYGFGLVYRRKTPYKTGQTTEDFQQNSAQLWANISAFLATATLTSGTALVGDFNFSIEVEKPSLNNIWLDSSIATNFILGKPIYQGYTQTLTSKHEKGLFEEITEHNLSQKVEDATHTNGNILDLIFSSPNFVKDIHNQGQVSITATKKQDHVILTFKLYLGRDCDI